MPKRARPYVICHMGPSIDGRITGMGSLRSLSSAYERTAGTFDADAWIIGRISMEPYAGKAKVTHLKVRSRIPRKDFIAGANAESYAIAIDPSGKLTWKSNAIDGEHVITILSERVPDDYLAFLQSKRVSYLFGGKTHIDLPKVLAKLRSNFGIRRLLLEGGGKINGSFLDADLIDELSILIAPVADGSIGTPTLFDVEKRHGPHRKLRLISVQKLEADLVWLRYKTKEGSRR
jgi:2,5-diamino-6-(ribosylamino)-4(3H)-pyrimidinone 5'-phosphate reductase